MTTTSHAPITPATSPLNGYPKCVRCGHAFVRHRGWNVCIDHACAGYRGREPLTLASIRVGDAFDVMGGYYVGARRAVVLAVETDAVVLRYEDGSECRLDRASVRTGGLRRVEV